MRLKRLENQYRCYLNPKDYHRIACCAESLRAHLAIELGGKCGLRVNETADLTLGQIRESTADEVDDAYFLQIWGKDTLGKREDGKLREPYLPLGVHHKIKEYKGKEEIETDDEPLFPVTKRTVQEYIKRAAVRAAERFEISDYELVSSHDLRAYWATDMLVRQQVDENVVMALGGWKSRANMEVYINAAFDDVIVREMADAGIR